MNDSIHLVFYEYLSESCVILIGTVYATRTVKGDSVMVDDANDDIATMP